MEKKNSKLFIVVALLLIVGIGTSFAYFLVGVTFKGEGATANVSTGKLPLVEYDAGSSTLSKDGLTPKDIISKTFKVIVTPTKDIKEATYRIFIDITSNTFVKCMEDNYDEFENACELNAEELVYRLKDSSGTVIKTGNLIGITGQIEIARETKMQDVKTEYSYTIEVEFKDTGKDQNHNTNKIFNASLNVEYAEEVITVDDIIARSNAKTTTPDFSVIATDDEGVFETTDGMYGNTTYYWRGAVENNYVQFAGFCWRIIRINGDKTIRMIYDGNICHANGASTTDSLIQPTSGTTTYTYNPEYNASYYVGWTYSSSQRPSSTNNNGSVGTSSNAKTQLQTWYNSSLASYEGKIAEGKYCNDRDTETGGSTGWVSTGTSFEYAGYKRLKTNKTPTFNCSNEGDVYTLKVGAITADEVAFAGGKFYASDGSSSNASYYLYNGQNYWTMSPYRWDGANANAFCVYSNGVLSSWGVYATSAGLRPVINLKADTVFAKDGLGTLDKPYACL